MRPGGRRLGDHLRGRQRRGRGVEAGERIVRGRRSDGRRDGGRARALLDRLEAGPLALEEIARDLAESRARKETDEAAKLQVLARVYWAMGRKADARQALTQLEAKYADIDAFDIACVYAERKDLDAAFKWLDRAYRTHDLAMIFLKIHPQLRNLYGDPRYQALLREMNLAV